MDNESYEQVGPNIVGGAVEVNQTYWDISEPTYKRAVGTDSASFIKVYQQSGFQPSLQQENWHFRLSDLNSYYLPSQSFFEFSFNIEDLAAEPTEATRNIIIPNDLRTMFKYAQLELNNVTVESNNTNYQFFANIDRSWWSRQYYETAGSIIGSILPNTMWDNPSYLPQLARQNSALTNFEGTGVQVYNGDVARTQSYMKHKFMACSKTVEGLEILKTCNMRVAMCDLFQFYRFYTKVHKGVDMSVRFTCNNDATFITDRTRNVVRENVGATQFRKNWVNSGIVWWCKTVKPSPRVEASLSSMLQKGVEILCPFESVKTYLFQPGVGGNSYRVVNESSRPVKMICGFQRKTCLNTTDDISVLQMPKGITAFTAFVNGTKVPEVDIKIRVNIDPPPPQGYNPVTELPDIDFSEIYQRYLEMCGTFTGNQYKENYSRGAGAYGYQEWCSVCPHISFDLSTNAIGAISGSNSEIVFQYECSEDLSAYNLYCMVYTERTVSLNLSNASTYVAVR